MDRIHHINTVHFMNQMSNLTIKHEKINAVNHQQFNLHPRKGTSLKSLIVRIK